TVTNGSLLTSANDNPGYNSRWARDATNRRNTMIEPIVANATRNTSQPVHERSRITGAGGEAKGWGPLGDGSTHGLGASDKAIPD
ncbi:MAG TPA: hypothetical protein VE242_00995, partial [Chthoniobacterales bacterium]|nr:hypothetical protein [Chthoniobacterales bacterium]